MTSTDWSILIPALVATLTAVSAWLKADTAGKKVTAHIQNQNRHIATPQFLEPPK